jgi:hypothetical protein
MRGEGPLADLLRQRFLVARRKAGLDRSLPPLSTEHFCPPPKTGDQLSLFEPP